MDQTEYNYPQLRKAGRPVSFFGYELMRDILIPRILGNETDAVLYWAGKDLARQFPLPFTEDIPGFFADAGWGELVLIKEKKKQIVFHLQGDTVAARLETMKNPSFDLEAGFIAEQVQQINEEYTETSIDFKLDKGYVVFIAELDTKEMLSPEELKMDGKIALYNAANDNQQPIPPTAIQNMPPRTEPLTSSRMATSGLLDDALANEEVAEMPSSTQSTFEPNTAVPLPGHNDNTSIFNEETPAPVMPTNEVPLNNQLFNEEPVVKTERALFNDDDYDAWQVDFNDADTQNNVNNNVPPAAMPTQPAQPTFVPPVVPQQTNEQNQNMMQQPGQNPPPVQPIPNKINTSWMIQPQPNMQPAPPVTPQNMDDYTARFMKDSQQNAQTNQAAMNQIPNQQNQEIAKNTGDNFDAEQEARVQKALEDIKNATKESAFMKLFEEDTFEDKTKEEAVKNAFSVINDFENALPPEPDLNEPLISDTLPPRSTSRKKRKK